MGFWNGQNTAGGSVGGKGPRGATGAGFKLTSDGNYDLENKKLTNVADATNNDEAVTKSQLDKKTRFNICAAFEPTKPYNWRSGSSRKQTLSSR